MANKHMKVAQYNLSIKNCKLDNEVPLTSISMAQVQNTTIAIAGKDVWLQELSLIAGGCTKWYSHLEESVEVSSKAKQSHYVIHLLNSQVFIYLI